MIAMLVMMALSQTPQHRLVLQPNLPRLSSAALVPFSLSSSGFSYGSVGTLPTCSGDAHCIALCTVNAGATAWQCVDSAGASLGTVTQGTGTTYQGTFAPGLSAMKDVTSAKTPRLVATALNPIWKADHTVIMGGYTTSQTSAIQHWMGFDDGAANSFYAREESAKIHCNWFGAGGGRDVSDAPSAVNGWSVVSCRRSGNNYIGRSNGADSSTVAGASISANNAVGTSYYMGDRQSAGNPMRGPLAFVAFYDEAKSTTWFKNAESSFWGVGFDAGLGLSGLTGMANDAGTDVDFFQSGAHIVSAARGLRTVGQYNDNIQAKWATDPFSVASWTDVGTPVINANIASGPFSRWKNAAECDEIVEVNAAAFEGKASAELQRNNGAGPAHGWNMRVWATSGSTGVTRDKMRIAIVSPNGVFLSDGGAEEDCDFTLTSSVRPYDCVGYTTDAGVTSVKGRVLVGNTAAAVGSVTVCNAQDTAHPYPQLSVTNDTAFGFASDSIDPSSWPSTGAKGKYELVFTPVGSINGTAWDNVAGTIYLFDAYNVALDHNVVMVGGYQIAGRLLVRSTASGANFTEFLVDGVTMTAGQRHALSMEWRPVGAKCNLWVRFDSCPGSAASCVATTVVASSTDGTGWCPGQPANLKLGNRFDNTVPSSINVDAVRVYQ